jgi:putative peptide zinc metalloprotease protein
MGDSLVSDGWYRVADLRPRLSTGVAIARQASRSRLWHVLTDPASGRQMRLNQAAYGFAGHCDGSLTVGEIWDLLLTRTKDACPSQEEVLRLIAQLHAGGMMQFDAAPNVAALFAQRDQREQRRQRAWVNPMVVKVRLFNPGPLVDRILPRVRILFTAPALAAIALLVAVGLLICMASFAELRAEAARLLQMPRTLLLFWLCYPPIKALHELAHALTLRRFGGSLRDAGVTLMFFTPAPYVDASSASTLQGRGQRALVSGAGILLELVLAALAAIAWTLFEPGLLRDLALVVLTICGISTLAVNGNPLLRFDGYYIATDLLDLPNLALRSNAWWAMHIRRLFQGGSGDPAPALADGELKWLVFYAPAALLYRAVLMVTLVLWAGGKSWLLGVVLVIGLGGWLAYRLWMSMRVLAGAGQPASARWRASVALATLAAFALLLFGVPVPHHIVAQGVVWPADEAQLRAESAGFVVDVPVRDGRPVVANETVVVLNDPVQAAERDRLQSQLAGNQAREYVALLRDPAQATALAEDVARNQAELARAEQRLERLQIASRVAGRLVLPGDNDLVGSFVQPGRMLGYILAPGPTNVRVALEEPDALLVRQRKLGAQVRFAEAQDQTLPAEFVRETPAATRSLPSAALGDRAGGRLVTDPADKEGTLVRDAVFLVDMAVPGLAQERIGSRAWVRFDVGNEPVGLQILRRARQLLLRHFNPASQA